MELFGKAAELFIAELSLASWLNVLPSKKIVQLNDVAAAVHTFHVYDFLLGIVPLPTVKPKRTVRSGWPGRQYIGSKGLMRGMITMSN